MRSSKKTPYNLVVKDSGLFNCLSQSIIWKCSEEFDRSIRNLRLERGAKNGPKQNL